ncbi:MAG: hypothetical protein EU536_00835 [Promethearchaeota archaeon]|nr:MAG: hypothetical protein EU536_00835 [Candidatus Lokiarchaeota archaeon]
MFKKAKDGSYTVKCNICSWNSTEPDKNSAEKKLHEHINQQHKEHERLIKEEESKNLPANLPGSRGRLR